MRVLIVGAAGQLGAAMTDRLRAGTGTSGAHDVLTATRADVDLRDAPALLAFIEARRPEVLINCAAYNDVDGAEDDPLQALDVNAIAVRTMAHGAIRSGAAFVHYSTDFVFDGRADQPYRETDAAHPESTYAASKLLGEWFAPQAAPCYVLRVESLFGGRAARSSIDKIITSVERGEEARVFADRIVSPSYVDDVVTATEALLAGPGRGGLYHCVNSGHGSWLEVGREIGRLLGVTPRLTPVQVADVPLRAKRPQYCALANDKLAAEVGWPMPSWQDALGRYLTTRKSS